MTIQRFSEAPAPPRSAAAVDLSSQDWVAPTAGILTRTPQSTSRVYVGTTGDLNVVFGGDETSTPVVLKNHPVGYAEIGVVKILKTGTTASNLVALF